MASEAISSSVMIIGAAVGAAVLMAAILPAIFSAGDTFGSVAYSSEKQMRTDFQIVNTFVNTGTPVSPKIWMKNTGAERISLYDLQKSDVYFGRNNNISMCAYSASHNTKTFDFLLPENNDGFWNLGQTVEITVYTGSSTAVTQDEVLTYTFVLPSSIRRSTSFGLTSFT